MIAQASLQHLPVNYPKPIMAKLLNSQSKAWEMMLSQHAMQLTSPIKEPAEAQNDRRGEVETSLVPLPKLLVNH